MSGSMRDALMQAMQQRQAAQGGGAPPAEDPMAELGQAIGAVIQLLTALSQNLQNPQVAGMLQQLSQASQQPQPAAEPPA